MANVNREFLLKALKIFESRSYLVNELSRATFMKGQLYRLMSDEKQAKKDLMQAWRLRKKLRSQDARKWDRLNFEDYDSLVAFWSR